MIYYTGRIDRPWQYEKKGNYEPLEHIVNAPTTLTKHKTKKYSYKQNK